MEQRLNRAYAYLTAIKLNLVRSELLGVDFVVVGAFKQQRMVVVLLSLAVPRRYVCTEIRKLLRGSDVKQSQERHLDLGDVLDLKCKQIPSMNRIMKKYRYLIYVAF